MRISIGYPLKKRRLSLVMVQGVRFGPGENNTDISYLTRVNISTAYKLANEIMEYHWLSRFMLVGCYPKKSTVESMEMFKYFLKRYPKSLLVNRQNDIIERILVLFGAKTNIPNIFHSLRRIKNTSGSHSLDVYVVDIAHMFYLKRLQFLIKFFCRWFKMEKMDINFYLIPAGKPSKNWAKEASYTDCWWHRSNSRFSLYNVVGWIFTIIALGTGWWKKFI